MDIFENPNYYFTDKPYKSKYICVNCKKVFKRRVLSDISSNKDLEEKAAKCSDCGQIASWVGPKFRAPKLDNTKAWNSVKVLSDLGLLNCIGFGNDNLTIPESKKGLKDFLFDLKNDYQYRIKQWTTNNYSSENKKQIKYFSDVINKIDKHLIENK